MQRKTIIALLIHTVIVFLILGIAALPLISVFIAGDIANANGCLLDEGSVHPCVVAGRDIGETLYSMGVMGWFMLITIPFGLGLAGVYILVVIVVVLIRRSRARTHPIREGADPEQVGSGPPRTGGQV